MGAEHHRVANQRGTHLPHRGGLAPGALEPLVAQDPPRHERSHPGPCVHAVARVSHAAGELEPPDTAERVREQPGDPHLRLLEVVGFLLQRRLVVRLGEPLPAVQADGRLQLPDDSPVPPVFPIEVARLERQVTQPAADLDRRRRLALPQHVAEHQRAPGPHEQAVRSSAHAEIRLADPLERQVRRVQPRPRPPDRLGGQTSDPSPTCSRGSTRSRRCAIVAPAPPFPGTLTADPAIASAPFTTSSSYRPAR